MKKIKGIITIITLIAIMMMSVGCNKSDTTKENEATDTTETEELSLSGKVTISGSTSVEPVGTTTADEFMSANPDVQITYDAIGSSSGIKNANDKVTNIGTASRELKEEEKAWKLTEKVIAYDGVAVVVHPDNEVTDISMEQVKKIYTGEITNWKDLGGKDEKIVIVSREDGSGTRGAFEEIVGFEGKLAKNAMTFEGNGNVQKAVSDNPNAIGYVSFTYINDTIKALKVEGTDPTPENVLGKTYKISRPFIMIYHEDNLDEAAKAYIDFVLSDEGQAVVEEEGAIPVK